MFDPKEFKNLLEKAIGDRKAVDFAEESSVNRTYISKYLNYKLNKPPAPDIIRRIADHAQNGVTYEDLMFACGYIASKSTSAFVKENVTLIRGGMSPEEMSEAIEKKLNAPEYRQLYSPDYIKDIESGKVIPVSQRINLLAMYAGVNEDFFYRVNTPDDLEIARREYTAFKEKQRLDGLYAELEEVGKIIGLDFVKEVLAFLKNDSIKLELKNFVIVPENAKYVEFAKSLKEKGINPDDIIGFSLKYEKT